MESMRLQLLTLLNFTLNFTFNFFLKGGGGHVMELCCISLSFHIY